MARIRPDDADSPAVGLPASCFSYSRGTPGAGRVPTGCVSESDGLHGAVSRPSARGNDHQAAAQVSPGQGPSRQSCPVDLLAPPEPIRPRPLLKTMPAPEVDQSVWREIFSYAWAGVLALVGLVWKQHERRIDAIEKTVADGDKSNADEIDRQRDNIAKLFDKLEEHGRRSEQRHIELLHALHEGLSRKADR